MRLIILRRIIEFLGLIKVRNYPLIQAYYQMQVILQNNQMSNHQILEM